MTQLNFDIIVFKENEAYVAYCPNLMYQAAVTALNMLRRCLKPLSGFFLMKQKRWGH